MPSGDFSQQDMLDALRLRICLTPPTKTYVLHENDLAKEFGHSRTPVRQALQRLAREHLVEIKPGVGTRVVQLQPSNREESFLVFKDFAQVAARHCDGMSLSSDSFLELSSVHGILNMHTERTLDLYAKLSSRVTRAISSVINDDIVWDAVVAAYWRVLRWRLDAVRHEPELHWQNFETSVSRLIDAASDGGASAVWQTAAGISKKYAHSA
jgi:DNA-binding GntR family transcriptional regulator